MEKRKTSTSAAAYHRQRQIEECLYQNLQRSSYQSISVSDICRQVGISRKAFYNYYHDKDACLCAIVDGLLRDSLLHTSKTAPDNADPLEVIVIFLDFWKEKKSFFDIVMRNNLIHFLLLRNMNYILNEDRTAMQLINTPEVKSDADILACYVASQLALMLQWYFRGFQDPTEEIARKYLRILHMPLIPKSGVM